MYVLGVILARGGSKGLPRKNVRSLGGMPLVAWTVRCAQGERRLDDVLLSTDAEDIARVGRAMGVRVVERPGELAGDTAMVDSAARHAVQGYERDEGRRVDAVVILYGNVPLRPQGLIGRAVGLLASSGADSVQSVCPVGKFHPYWMHRVVDGDMLEPYEANRVYRRQDLPPVYQLDGGLIAVTRASLFTVREGEPHAFLGEDRRAVLTKPGEVVDVDTMADLAVARALLKQDEGAGPEGAGELEGFAIGAKRVGAGCGCYVIAELGVNHDGDVGRALELVAGAKGAGADAVKVQLFDARLLLSAEAEMAAYQVGAGADARDMLDRLQLGVEDLGRVREEARRAGLGFVATCFSLELVGALCGLGVDAVKVASPDAVNLPLVEAVLGVGKPVLVSCGACDEGELAGAIDLCRWQVLRGGDGVGFMQCVSAYPPPQGEARLGEIASLKRLWGGVVGYSDHTTALDTGALAVAAGALVIEKHLTYDRGAAGPDHSASFDPAQFGEYVRRVRAAERAMGDGVKRVMPYEEDVRRVSRQSVCAVRDLAAGDVVRREDVTVKRPGTGVPAVRLAEVVGKRLVSAVRADHLIQEGDVAW